MIDGDILAHVLQETVGQTLAELRRQQVVREAQRDFGIADGLLTREQALQAREMVATHAGVIQGIEMALDMFAALLRRMAEHERRQP